MYYFGCMLPRIVQKFKFLFILKIIVQVYLKDPDIYVVPHVTMRCHYSA